MTLLLLAALVFQEFHCPTGSEWMDGIATTSYVVRSGCYTKPEADQAMDGFSKSLCGESGFISCEFTGKWWACTGHSSEWKNGICITEEVLPDGLMEKPKLPIPDGLK